jgi:hypothetical protein
MASRLKTLRERLRSVQSAIAEVETGGQSVSLDDGVSYTRAHLPRLYEREAKLYGAIARAEGRRPFFSKVKMGSAYSGVQ